MIAVSAAEISPFIVMVAFVQRASLTALRVGMSRLGRRLKEGVSLE
jgi:hypothetical protein